MKKFEVWVVQGGLFAVVWLRRGRVCSTLLTNKIEVGLKHLGERMQDACEALLCHISSRQYRFINFLRLDDGESMI